MAVLGWGLGGDGGHWRWEVVSHVGHMVSPLEVGGSVPCKAYGFTIGGGR